MATLTIKPTAAGNDVQIKSGDGNTTHATFGDTSTVTLGTATIADATITAGTFPAGHILKVKSAIVGAKLSTTATSAQNISGLAVTTDIPASNASKFLITIHLGCMGTAQVTSTRIYFKVTGGNMANLIGDAATGHEAHMTFCPRAGDGSWTQMPASIGPYLDAPATTSAVTYQVQWWLESGNQTGYLNSSPANDANSGNTSSSITVMEVAQ